jgi:hypothetical protein
MTPPEAKKGARTRRRASMTPAVTRMPPAIPISDGFNSASSCAWCSRALEGEGGFLLRAGALLCDECAARAGRIAASQSRRDT